jgi:hypothetical protein
MSTGPNSGEDIFRPYARLISILGDQLITNKIIAVNEIVKNSYDADSDEVTVRFIHMENFGKKNIPDDKKPVIEIEDDGVGMTIETIRNVWLKPATPNKFNIKKGEKRFTKKGRLMQGEKGIGRFAVHKLGDHISIFTKVDGGKEANLVLDFSEYDRGHQFKLFEKQSDIDTNYKFLDQITNKWFVNEKPEKIQKKKGTLIQIKNIRENWTDEDLSTLYKSFKNLIPPTIPKEDQKDLALDIKIATDFSVTIKINKIEFKGKSSNITFKSVCEEAPFKFIAEIDNKGNLKYNYTSTLLAKRNVEGKFNLIKNDKAITLHTINKRFYKLNEEKQRVKTHDPACGPFKFILYGFDLTDKAKWKAKKDEEAFIKDNSVYLFRDGVRVYPYGNKEIDWLQLGRMRAEIKAGDFFSYNDLVGFIFISHDNNQNLKDATNREGLMDYFGAYEDFKALLSAAIQVMKYESDIDKGKEKNKKTQPLQLLKKNLSSEFSKFNKHVSTLKDKKARELGTKYTESVKAYTSEIERRADIYEDLAGLGLAVEKASHDSLSLIEKMSLNLKDLRDKLAHNHSIPQGELVQTISDLYDNTYFLYEQLQLIQPLFRYAKRSETTVSIKDVVDKVCRYYKLELESYKITVEIKSSKDIQLQTSVGLMLQVIINLMDNAVYWLKEKGDAEFKKIQIIIDGSKNELIFADNGIGIDPEVAPLIFMEFYTTKPKERGRGLGLFIAKEIIDRTGGNLEVISNEKNKLLKGANFKITFPNLK